MKFTLYSAPVLRDKKTHGQLTERGVGLDEEGAGDGHEVAAKVGWYELFFGTWAPLANARTLTTLRLLTTL